MEIRFAKGKDVPGIITLLRQVGRVHHEGRPDLFRNNAQKYGASQVLAMLNSSQTPIFVAVEDEKVLGYGFCQMRLYEHDPVICDHLELYIDDLCVDETLRGQHVGKQLYDYVLAFAKENGFYNVTLNVWSCNEGAMKFYEKCGLKPQKVGMEVIL